MIEVKTHIDYLKELMLQEVERRSTMRIEPDEAS
jgi:hypothetical protein